MGKKGVKNPGRGGAGVVPLGVRKDGKRYWLATIKYRDPLTSKVKWAERTYAADSKFLAMQERARIKDELLEKAAAPAGRQRFRDVAALYLATITRAGTLKSYRSWVKRLNKTRIGDAWIDAITTQHLQAVLAGILLGKTAMDSIRVVMINVFDHAKGLGLVKTNPAHDVEVKNWRPGRPKKRKALTRDETVRLIADLRQHSYDLHVMVAVMYVLAARFAEVSALWWDDIDMATGIVTLRRGQTSGAEGPLKGYRTPPNKPATGKAERVVALGPTALDMLQKHRARMAKEQWPGWERIVFPNPPEGQGKRTATRRHDYWEHRTVSAQLKAAYDRLGYDLGAVTHCARHTANNIARMHANEVFLREVIGHSKAELTVKYSEIDHGEVISFAQEQERRMLGAGAKSRTRK